MNALVLSALLVSACGSGERRAEEDAGTQTDGGGGLACEPGTTRCERNDVRTCTAAGTWISTEHCDPSDGLLCRAGSCYEPCSDAAILQSYLGCEYWPTVTPNSALPTNGEFDFAVVVGNPQAVPVIVTVERIGEPTRWTRVIEAGDVAAIELPWVAELMQRGAAPGTLASVLVRHGAYRLTSTLPVTAYSFNPLQFGSEDCDVFSEDDGCSVTNDAALLLPTGALSTRYLAISMPTFTFEETGIPLAGGDGEASYGAPGYVSIVGTDDGTEVSVTFSAYTKAGPDIRGYEPGESAVFRLDRGDVLELFSDERLHTPGRCSEALSPLGTACEGDAQHDLTGTVIDATKPVAVFGGAVCHYVPFDRMACDHLVEQLFPLETWGRTVAAVSTEPLDEGLPNVWKVVAGSDEDTIVFEPEVHAPVTLSFGESMALEHDGAFVVQGTGRIALVQLMVGGDYAGVGTGSGVGDPAMSLGIPIDQYRTSYDFLIPDTYQRNWVNVIAPTDSLPTLDGAALGPLTPIGATGLGYARIELEAGAHHMLGAQRFGITVVGVAWFTSYMFPGGLDLSPLLI